MWVSRALGSVDGARDKGSAGDSIAATTPVIAQIERTPWNT